MDGWMDGWILSVKQQLLYICLAYRSYSETISTAHTQSLSHYDGCKQLVTSTLHSTISG